MHSPSLTSSAPWTSWASMSWMSWFACLTTIVVALASSVMGHSHSHGAHHGHGHGHNHAHALPESLASLAALVGDDDLSLLIVCTILLTAVPLVLMFALPKNLPGPVERVLVSFALGTMLSDIFLHLLPETLAAGDTSHAHDEHDHHHHHHHHDGVLKTPAHKVLAGFLAFYAVERIMGLLVNLSSPASSHTHSHSHDHASNPKKHDGDCNHARDSDSSTSSSTTNIKDSLRQRTSNLTTTTKPATETTNKKPAGIKSTFPPINAIIHVFATSIHVASDGLLLSMAFSRGPSTGLSTFLGVFLHEIPHRLADWALIQGGLGMTRNQAIVAQLYLTCASLAGVFAGAALVPASAIEQMMPIVAGGLLYTATVGVVPELTGGHSHGHDHGEEGHGHSHSHSHSHAHSHEEGGTSRVFKLVQVVVEIGALIGGIAFMGSHAH